jgi:hypothetical protein
MVLFDDLPLYWWVVYPYINIPPSVCPARTDTTALILFWFFAFLYNVEYRDAWDVDVFHLGT